MTRRGKIFTAIGLLLLLAALCLTAYNLMTDAMASMQVQVTLEALKPELEEAEASEVVSVQPVRETALEEIPDYLLNCIGNFFSTVRINTVSDTSVGKMTVKPLTF